MNTSSKLGFNPRVLAGGRDDDPFAEKNGVRVSIHASSREDATSGLRYGLRITVVSIHASSREDATMGIDAPYLSAHFNPRVLAGGRDTTQNIGDTNNDVSIHASSREDATLKNYTI